MSSTFDTIIDRTGTNSLKYDFVIEHGMPEDTIPLWVADMDFMAPPKVLEEIQKVVTHGIFGYTDTKNDYFETLSLWFSTHFNWKIKEDWLIKTPGVMFAIANAIRCFTEKGDSVMIQQPVYYPFADIVKDNERNLVINHLTNNDGYYTMDYDDLEQKIINQNVKIFMLCSPHNPVGRVWTKRELRNVSEICERHHVLVISDEIHCDFIMPGYRHTIYASIGGEVLNNCIICTAPSKTFNLAGLQVSNIFIPNKDLRNSFINELKKTGYSELNSVGIAACQAAYKYGEDWLTELISYLQENVEYLQHFFQTELPKIHMKNPEGTYLIWLNFNHLGLTNEQIKDRLTNQARLWLSPGTIFEKESTGFFRMNIACPRSTLEKAVKRMKKAFQDVGC